MNTMILVAMVLAGTDSLTKVSLKGVTVKAPIEWKLVEDDSSRTWSAPGDEAEFAISVFPVEPQRPAKACVDQIVAALSPPPADGGAEPVKAFESLMLGAQPAAKKVTTDYVGEGEAAKVDDNKVTTTTLVGCNGKTKWVITYSSKTKAGARFGPILKRIIDSVGYGK